MREILFKAKRLDNGEWVEGQLFCRKYSGTDEVFEAHIIQDAYEQVNVMNFGVQPVLISPLVRDKYDEGCFRVDANTLCQYTGLTDKNGNLIWENDILHLKEKIRTKTREILTTVDWDDRSGCFLFEEDANGCAVGLDAITNCGIYEIIENKGSKFDNPELIGGGE